ncbi:MAG: hypothetical protein Q8922_12765 [Bacteroidota bacterium]|nr:hypothetical protein [Bacteroidota bacterium]MDP4233073.1 hypothetical protein [Bacteroidota bacterium]MDP4241782.1 hypothetical protein [Bacteroidota bacterium]MDP4288797.1 hypothetical protein [Bacteroidota bacterium]
MNWKLIFLLSLIGVAMAVLTVSVIPSTIEPLVWLVIFAFNAWVITSRVPKGKYFLHAFCVSVVSGVWIGLIHAALHDTYLANHMDEAKQFANAPWGTGALAMIYMGPIFGAFFGLISGLVSMLVGKLRKPKAQAA